MLVHTDITQRALKYIKNDKYKQILNSNINTLLAGAPFPDWG